ncbi:MAG: penicillin-binding protein activator, partial [Rhodobacterales bacterium]|nr:penicillin-binding protein activator [Rhodobacterales bacterium]MDX5412055.1 penicillin-binding protein activator [Rhodobacterales bacterium]
MFAFLSPTRKPLFRVADLTVATLLSAGRSALDRLRSVRGGVLAVTAMGALAACEPVDTSLGQPAPSINASAPVPVALLVPRGSGNASDEVLARALENAARLAIADLGEVAIDLRVYSSAASAATTQQVALQAVADGAKVILGPVYGENANAAAVAVASSGVNVLA